MARYNHFSNIIYEPICFGSINEGDKFRMDKRNGKRRRKDIVCIKTGDLTYQEVRSKKTYTLHSSALEVSSYSIKVKQTVEGYEDRQEISL